MNLEEDGDRLNGRVKEVGIPLEVNDDGLRETTD